jgi:hypothetical protein
VTEFFEDVNFREEQFFEFLGFERIEFDNFDGDGLICVLATVLVTSLRPLYTFEKFPWPSISSKLNT